MQTTTAVLRYRLFGVLTATALGGAAAVALTMPSADAAKDPCAASSIAKTVGSVAEKTGDYLDSHPETNQAMTTALQSEAGPASAASLKSYFDANPKVATDLQGLTQPLQALSAQCKLPVGLPQVTGLLQAAQNSGVPAVPGSGTQNAALPGPAPTARS